MQVWHFAICTLVAAFSDVGYSQLLRTVPVPTERQLSDVTPEEATSLIRRLEDGQAALRAKEFQMFELLAGSIASSGEARISAIDAFMQIPFKQVWSIRRNHDGTGRRQPFVLAYAPKGLGQPYWEITVIEGFDGRLERVQMLYRAPAPF